MRLHTRMIRLAVTLLTCGVMWAGGCGDDDATPDASTDPTFCNPFLGGVEGCTCATGTGGFRKCASVGDAGDVGRWGSCICNEPQSPMPCTVGATFECYCANGSRGLRECRAMNTYTACMCGNDMNMDAGHADAGTNNDGG